MKTDKFPPIARRTARRIQNEVDRLQAKAAAVLTNAKICTVTLADLEAQLPKRRASVLQWIDNYTKAGRQDRVEVYEQILRTLDKPLNEATEGELRSAFTLHEPHIRIVI